MQPTEVVDINRQIRRVVAGNPSPMTGPGTNSYLIGRGGGLVLLDPGPNLPPHRAAILSALAPGEWIEAIVVSHAHADHSAGAPDLARETGAPVLAFGTAAAGRSPVMAQLAAQGLVAGGEGVDHAFQPDRSLGDGAMLQGDWGEVEVIHTPGHMAGHLCLAHQGVLFSGDHAMGWSSSIVSPPDGDMADYMASLRRLSARQWRMMLPGHGPAVAEATDRLAALLAHRQRREAEVLAALAYGPADAATLARRLYRDLSPRLLPAAERNVLAHLIDLWSRNRIKTADVPRLEAIFHL
jgi:hydroxyacylglutathione hydrolase